MKVKQLVYLLLHSDLEADIKVFDDSWNESYDICAIDDTVEGKVLIQL